jgi:hypothetical protein
MHLEWIWAVQQYAHDIHGLADAHPVVSYFNVVFVNRPNESARRAYSTTSDGSFSVTHDLFLLFCHYITLWASPAWDSLWGSCVAPKLFACFIASYKTGMASVLPSKCNEVATHSSVQRVHDHRCVMMPSCAHASAPHAPQAQDVTTTAAYPRSPSRQHDK